MKLRPNTSSSAGTRSLGEVVLVSSSLEGSISGNWESAGSSGGAVLYALLDKYRTAPDMGSHRDWWDENRLVTNGLSEQVDIL